MLELKNEIKTLLNKIYSAGMFGYALYAAEIVELLYKPINDTEKRYYPRSVEGLVEFVTHFPLHGVPLYERNKMVKKVLQCYVDSLRPIE